MRVLGFRRFSSGLIGQFGIPVELEIKLMELSNNLEVQLVADVVDGLQEIDPIPDLPLDDWRDSIFNRVGDVSIPIGECD